MDKRSAMRRAMVAVVEGIHSSTNSVNEKKQLNLNLTPISQASTYPVLAILLRLNLAI